MPSFNITKACQAIVLSLISTTVLATEQPDASTLVGESYVGAHGMYIKTDSDRLFTLDKMSSIDHGTGIGGELGYRISELYEARFSLTHLNLDADYTGYDLPSGSSIALDLLYFPNKSNFYLLAGADFLDITKADLSANLGAGYRYHLSDNAALYFEGKTQYQFDDSHRDFSTKLGFIYYFGKKTQEIKRKEPAAAPAPTVMPTSYNNTQEIVELDSDKDGIFDSKDQCPNTPMVDKVDVQGCTIFTEQQETMHLVVNFENNKSDVAEVYYDEIEKAATFMSTYPHTQLTINGHTSVLGDAAYNQQLSEKRAQAVVDVLVNKFSVAQDRLTAVGHGEEQVKNSANTTAAHAQNRRIEATIAASKKVSEKR